MSCVLLNHLFCLFRRKIMSKKSKLIILAAVLAFILGLLFGSIVKAEAKVNHVTEDPRKDKHCHFYCHKDKPHYPIPNKCPNPNLKLAKPGYKFEMKAPKSTHAFIGGAVGLGMSSYLRSRGWSTRWSTVASVSASMIPAFFIETRRRETEEALESAVIGSITAQYLRWDF